MQTRPKPWIVGGALATAMTVGIILTSAASAADRVVIVQAGETLSMLALRYGVTVTHLVVLNDIADPDRILAGQRLVIARDDTSAAPAAAPATAATHRVAFGETLTGIARRYGISIGAIASLNGIANPSYIREGQILAIPGAPAPAPSAAAALPAPAASVAPPAQPAAHRVGSGETLTSIASYYGTTIDAIASLNGIANPSYIRTGQVLLIPNGAASGASGGGAGSNVPGSMAARVAQRDGVRRLIVAEAGAQGVPPAFALAVAWQESGWQQGVVSSAGAIGIMQLIPASGTWVGEAMLGEPVNLYDAASNVRAGVRLLRHYLDRYGGDRGLALAAYYQGQTAVDRHGIYSVSWSYINSILELERIFSR